jgi:hypothetical protein
MNDVLFRFSGRTSANLLTFFSHLFLSFALIVWHHGQVNDVLILRKKHGIANHLHTHNNEREKLSKRRQNTKVSWVCIFRHLFRFAYFRNICVADEAIFLLKWQHFFSPLWELFCVVVCAVIIVVWRQNYTSFTFIKVIFRNKFCRSCGFALIKIIIFLSTFNENLWRKDERLWKEKEEEEKNQ